MMNFFKLLIKYINSIHKYVIASHRLSQLLIKYKFKNVK